MSVWRQVTRGIRMLGNRRVADEEIAEEVNHYLEESTAMFAARGLTPDEAREVTHMARRIAALILLQPELDKNYAAVKSASTEWSGFATGAK